MVNEFYNLFNLETAKIMRNRESFRYNVSFRIPVSINPISSFSWKCSDDAEYEFVIDSGATRTVLSAKEDLYDILSPIAKDYGLRGVSPSGNLYPLLEFTLPRIIIDNSIVIRNLFIGLTKAPNPLPLEDVKENKECCNSILIDKEVIASSLVEDSKRNIELPDLVKEDSYCLLGTDLARFFKNNVSTDYTQWKLSLERLTLLNGFLLSDRVVDPSTIWYVIPDYMKDSDFCEMLLYKFYNKLNTEIYKETLSTLEAKVAAIYDIFDDEYPGWKMENYPRNPFNYIEFIRKKEKSVSGKSGVLSF